MEEIKFKAVCKELNGSITTSDVTLESDNDFVFSTSTEGPTVTADQIDSGTAVPGQVLTADGNGGADWDDIGSILENLIEIDSASGTLGAGDLILAQNDVSFIKLTQNGTASLFRKYLQTDTTIYFTYVSTSAISGGSTQMSRSHIDVTISTGAYTMADGELFDGYSKDQIDAAFIEEDID